MLSKSNFVEPGSLLLFSLDLSKSFLFEEVSFVDDIQRVVLVGDEGLFDDWDVWVLALVALHVLVLHHLHVVPAIIDGMQTLMGKSQGWGSASTTGAMKINSLILFIDQIL